jgi:hypothetical protein
VVELLASNLKIKGLNLVTSTGIEKTQFIVKISVAVVEQATPNPKL